MSRIHDALKKAEQEKPPESLLHVAVTAEASSASSSNHGAPEHAPRASHQGGTAMLEGEAATMEAVPKGVLESCQRLDWNAEANLVRDNHSHRQAVVLEQFRSLRSALLLTRKRQRLQKILVTSALPQEGKSFASVNLALTFARQPDSRVLLIDADLRIPTLNAILGAPGIPGLSEYLAGAAELSAVLQRGAANNFFFIPGGERPANPSELLGNGRLELLLERLAPLFDWVVLDSPPTIPVSDSRLAAQFCDGVLMLIRAGVTPSDMVQKACKEFPRNQLLGVVLNYAEFQPGYGYYYHYYGEGKSERGNGKR